METKKILMLIALFTIFLAATIIIMSVGDPYIAPSFALITGLILGIILKSI